MIDINIINSIIKILFINFCTTFIFLKSSTCRKLNKLDYLLLIFNNIFVAIIFAFLRKYQDILFSFVISYTLYSFIINFISKGKLNNTIFVTAISLAISNLFMVISAVINFFLLIVIPFYTEDILLVEYIIIGLIQSLLTYLFFKIKRFQHGFSFLKESSKINDSTYIGSMIGVFSLMLCILFGMVKDIKIWTYFTISLIVLGLVLYRWIHLQMKKYYQNEVIDKTISSLKSEIETLKSKLSVALKLNHNYSHRISALEAAIKNSDVEFSKELNPDLISSVKSLSTDFRSERITSTNNLKLPSTNVYSIDNILEYMLHKANENNIELKVQINDSVKYIVENIITEGEFITILSNHIQNSIIAINSADSQTRTILVILGLIDNCFGFSIFDTGIEFQLDTLLQLGEKEVTTNKSGSGIGFMTTFEMAKKYNYSILIEENNPITSKYTKSVNIKFDNKCEYKIISYRSNTLKQMYKDNKILIENR